MCVTDTGTGSRALVNLAYSKRTHVLIFLQASLLGS